MKKCCENIIQVGTNTKSNLTTLQLVSLYDYIYGMIGYFPTDVWELEPDLCTDAKDNWTVLIKQLTNDKIVGIGKIGLDYNWNKVGRYCVGEDAQKIQQKWFRRQLDLAHELNLPVSIHSRDAEADTLAIFEDYESISGVIHCFSYGLSAAKKALDKELYLGIGGTSTYPSNKELREVIKMMPLDRLLLETDAPYLSPQAVRKGINTSENIKYVVENISKLKGVSHDIVIEQTNQNAYSLFGRLN
jgi:TatD DNase family protein